MTDELARARVLLGAPRLPDPVVETAPARPAEEVGALDGLGFQVGPDQVHVDVFVFADPRSAAAAAVAEPRGTHEGVYAVAGSNGRLMLTGHVDIGGADGRRLKYALAAVASAFAGDE